jgi:hypothetical protein
MAGTSRWVRLDVDFGDTEWLFPLSGLAELAWVKLLAYAKRSGIRGRVRCLSPSVAAEKWKCGLDAFDEMMTAATAGDNPAVIEVDGDWFLTGWDRYNPIDRTNADRQRHLRERSRRNGHNGA